MAARRVKSEDRAGYRAASCDSPQDKEVLDQARAILYRSLVRGAALTDPTTAGEYCALRLRGLQHEVFLVVFMDTKHRVIAAEEMFRGTLDGAEVHPREIIKRALELNAAALILAHNHPSGVTDPSTADRAVTTRLKQACALVDVRILDHFIVADGERPCSMAQLGAV